LELIRRGATDVELELDHGQALAQALGTVLDRDPRGAVAEQGEHAGDAPQQAVDALDEVGGAEQVGQLDRFARAEDTERGIELPSDPTSEGGPPPAGPTHHADDPAHGGPG